MRLVIFFLFCFYSLSASASVPSAYVKFAKQYQVNPQVLYAVARAESTWPRHPLPPRPAWPWTANIGGKSYYFSTREALYRKLHNYLQTGRLNFDVGIMQINWQANSHYFKGDLWSATDPYTNIAAGARHLSQLLSKHKSYIRAIGLYHTGSTNTAARKARAERYTRRVFTYLVKSGGKHS